MSESRDDDRAESPAVADAVRLLRHRLRSTAELRGRLQEKGYAEATIEACLTRLAAAGFLDDRRFAVAFVRDGVQLQRRGSARLRRELRAKGVAEDCIDEALALELPVEREAELAEAVAASTRAHRRLPPLKARRGWRGTCSGAD